MFYIFKVLFIWIGLYDVIFSLNFQNGIVQKKPFWHLQTLIILLLLVRFWSNLQALADPSVHTAFFLDCVRIRYSTPKRGPYAIFDAQIKLIRPSPFIYATVNVSKGPDQLSMFAYGLSVIFPWFVPLIKQSYSVNLHKNRCQHLNTARNANKRAATSENVHSDMCA